MTILTVKHVTTYSYAAPVRLGEHRMMLRPRDSNDQRLLDATLDIEPRPERCAGFTTSSTIASRSPTSREIREAFGSRATSVRAHALRGARVPAGGPRATTIRSPMTPKKCPISPDRSSGITPTLPASSIAGFSVFVHPGRADGDRDAADDLDLCDQGRAGLRTAHREGNASPLQTLASRRGSCRDFATLMMEAARALGVRRPLRLRLSLCARSRHRRAPSRRRLDACMVPDLSARLRLGRIRSRPMALSAIAISFASRSRGRRDRPFPFTAPISATPRTKRDGRLRHCSAAAGTGRFWPRRARNLTPASSFRESMFGAIHALRDTHEDRQMLIQAGFDIAFECPAPTPMLLQLNVHPSREADLLSPDRIVSDPPLPMRDLSRSFRQPRHARRGPAGPRHFLQSLRDPRLGRSPTKRRPTRGRRRSPSFPTTRCCSWSRAAIATATSSPISPGRSSGDRRRIAARAGDLRFRPCENPLQLPRRALDPLRQRLDARRRRRLPRLRPSRHRALPLHEHPGALLHRLSRRHRRAGRRQPDGFQRLVRGLSRWPLVHDGRASQPSPHRPHRHGTGPRRRRRRDFDRLRRRQSRALRGGDRRATHNPKSLSPPTPGRRKRLAGAASAFENRLIGQIGGGNGRKTAVRTDPRPSRAAA